jgi:formylglycine-generating enzyme
MPFRCRPMGALTLVAFACLIAPGAAPAHTRKTPPQAAGRDTFTNPKDGLRYVRIPAGSFRMGCVCCWTKGYKPSDKDCNDEESPRHTVSISGPFWLSQTEVTVAAYRRFCAATSHPMPPGPRSDPAWSRETAPITMVTWDDALAYCTWAGGRLPTEAEWEYAARAGTAGQFSWGDAFDRQQAWSRVNVAGAGEDEEPGMAESNKEEGRPQTVGALKPNPWGLYDVVGNVWEWCADWYGASYYPSSPAADPKGPPQGELKVQRGGSWYDIPWAMRLSARGRAKPGYRSDNAGIRCLLANGPSAPNAPQALAGLPFKGLDPNRLFRRPALGSSTVDLALRAK